jgi:preprotein translocase subunit SecG
MRNSVGSILVRLLLLVAVLFHGLMLVTAFEASRRQDPAPREEIIYPSMGQELE